MKFSYILSLFFITLSLNTISGDAQHAGCSSDSAPKRSEIIELTGDVKAIDEMLRYIYGINEIGVIAKKTNPDARPEHKATLLALRLFIEKNLEQYTSYVKRLGEFVPEGCVPVALRLLQIDTGYENERVAKLEVLIENKNIEAIREFIKQERCYFINKIDKDPVDALPLHIIQKIYDLLSPVPNQSDSQLIHDLRVRILLEDFYDEYAKFDPKDAPFLASIDHRELSKKRLLKLKTCFEEFLKKHGPDTDNLKIIEIEFKIKDIDQLIRRAEFVEHPCGRELLELFHNLDMDDENIEYFSDSNKDEILKKIKFLIKEKAPRNLHYSEICRFKKKMLVSQIELFKMSVDCKYNVQGILEDLNYYLKKINDKLDKHSRIQREVNRDEDKPKEINDCSNNKMLQEALAISVLPTIRPKSLKAILTRMRALGLKINNIDDIIKYITTKEKELDTVLSLAQDLELILQDNPKLSDYTIRKLKERAAACKEIADEIPKICSSCYLADKFGIRKYQMMAFRQFNYSYTEEMQEVEARLRNFAEKINRDF